MRKYDLEELNNDLVNNMYAGGRGLRKAYISLKQLLPLNDAYAVYARNFFNQKELKEFYLFFENKLIQVSEDEKGTVSIKTYHSKIRLIDLEETKSSREGISLKIYLEDSSFFEFHSVSDSSQDFNEEYIATLKDIYTYNLLNN